MFIYNSTKRKEKRRYLRRQLTEAEKVIWEKVRNKKLGFVFQRQYSIGPYFLDFYCPARRLAIEVDGGQHNDIADKKYDSFRTEYLNKLDIKVIRFWNNEVLVKTEEIVEQIYFLLHAGNLPLE